MALNPHFRTATRNAMLDIITTHIGASGGISIYAGGQPADASTATTAANTVVATLALAATAFVVASNGIMTANSITSDTNAAGGTAAWFSFRAATGARIFDGSVGISSGVFDLVVNSVTIATGSTVAISSFTVTQAA